ncbi:MAG: hypothetical protein AABX38_05590 [Candidatus Micrarchaeota archaeon]
MDSSNLALGNGRCAVKSKKPLLARQVQALVDTVSHAIRRSAKLKTQNRLPTAQSSKLKAHHKGQVATEFLMYTGMFILMVVIAFVAVSYIQSAELPARQANLIKQTGEEFSSAINLAVTAGTGFKYSFTFPKSILERDYLMLFDTSNSRLIIVSGEDPQTFTYAYPLNAYNYRLEGCIASNNKLQASQCKNTLELYNDGNTLTIRQPS